MKPLFEVDPDVVYLRSARNLLGPSERALLRDASQAVGFRSTSDPISWLTPAEQDQLRAYLADAPVVEQAGRYAFRLDGRLVDFTPYVKGVAPIDEVSYAG
jgi:alpha-galactosidase